MGKANLNRQALVEAIATIEAQRGLSGSDRDLDRAVTTVLRVLRERLAQLQAEPGDRQRHHLAVLVADLSGYTALSEHMDVEWLSDAINSMWGVLDAVIRAWGGQIDQHAGDSLMAVFGLPTPRRGDTIRALRAALAMQQELQLFNKRVRQAADHPGGAGWALDWPGPSMRIGIHSGIVYFAHTSVNASVMERRATAVGATIAEARRLEKLAPAGGVLASVAVNRQAQNQFQFTPIAGNSVAGASENPAYLVAGERPVSMDYQPGTIAGQVTRLVGRVEQLDQLELALQTVLDSRAPQLVTIVGPSGAGKSRLVHEFMAHARLFAGTSTILRAGTQGAYRGYPFALVRDLLLRQFNLHPQDSRYLIEHKLRQGIAEFSRRSLERQAEVADPFEPILSLLEQLIDAGTAATLTVDKVLAVVGPLLRAVTDAGPTIAILEGIGRADKESLDLVYRLARTPEIGPIMFIGVTTVTTAIDPAATLPWIEDMDDIFSPTVRIDIPPLTPVESRLMATQILRPLAPPMRLVDLVVAGAEGNPLYIEGYVRLLIERGVIVTGERWRIDMVRAEATTIPTGLLKLIEARLSHLTDIERIVLRRAAVFGSLCWDAALLETISASDFGETEIEAGLLSLEKKRYLVRDDIYSFAATQAYAFWRDTVREAAYDTVPEGERRTLHLEAADWLIANQNNARFSAWFPIDSMIARHFSVAGETIRAEAWQRRTSPPEATT